MTARTRWIALLGLLVVFGAGQELPAQDDKRPKVLLIGKQPDHPHGTHMYMHTCRVLAKCLEKNGDIKTVVSNGWPTDAKDLEGVQTIVLYSTPGAEFLLDGPGAGKFHEMMRRGVGLVTLHWASSVYEKNLERLGDSWGDYLGGFWVSNYGLSTDRSPLKQLVPDHPICRGWTEYDLHDEFYLKPVLRGATPLLRVSTKGEDVVVGWAFERPGGGRGYGTTLGHFYRNFQMESFRRTVVNAILWTAQVDVPPNGADVSLDEVELRLPPAPVETSQNLRDKNLVAWCIVPFDAKERGPQERAEMVRRLGLRRVAYDWRAKHVPTFEDEILQYKKNGIEFFAFWGFHEEAFKLFKKYQLHPQIWQTLGSPDAETQADRVRVAAGQLLELVDRTRELGCKLGLYNHGGWGGEPDNLIAVCEYLRKNHNAGHVGIVYNLHHAHGHLDDFGESLAKMKPYLLCLNLNGMTRDGDTRGQKILPLGEGEFDVALLKTIDDSGYDGPVGIIGHTQDDVQQRLSDNLDGLHWILPQLGGQPAGPKPKWRTHPPVRETPKTPPAKLQQGAMLQGDPAYRTPPLTIECVVTLADARGYNILVASDTKRSGAHWELFSMKGDGTLTAFTPGLKPDHVRSRAMICDGKPHYLAMIYQRDRIRLFVDGRQVADQSVDAIGRDTVAGGLSIGRLVEGSIGCRGTIDWVRLSKGTRAIAREPPDEVRHDEATLLLWRQETSTSPRDAVESRDAAAEPTSSHFQTPDYSVEAVTQLVTESKTHGDPHRGLLRFADARTACLSCHRIGSHGGRIGPDLTRIGTERKPSELVESVLWPRRRVKPEFMSHLIIDVDGRTHQGLLVREDDRGMVLRDPAKPDQGEISIAADDIDLHREAGTSMPDNLAGTMTEAELLDLLRFVVTLGTKSGVPPQEANVLLAHAGAHAHHAAEFPYDRRPLDVDASPNWQHHVNRDRLYDFYAKQAEAFRRRPVAPVLLAEYPGLDGGLHGHWGNQNDEHWVDGRWNQSALGSVVSGVFRGRGVTVPKAVCVRLGKDGGTAVCFNPQTLTYDAVWTGGFVQFSTHRRGFLGGMRMEGTPVAQPSGAEPREEFRYHGFYRCGEQVLFSYSLGGVEMLNVPALGTDGRFQPIVAPREKHPLESCLDNAPSQWPQEFETEIELGNGDGYVIDNIKLPVDNPWNALLFCGGHAFLPDGSAVVCTMQGDVWRVSGFEYPSRTATWRRFASGLHQALGVVADQDGIFVLGRDQITRLHDLNDDGEADFYECFSNAFTTSPGGHDFICGLQRDREGNCYIGSSNQGLVRVSADGDSAESIATGFRNPGGLGRLPDGTLTVPCSEGDWTPASMICALRPVPGQVPHFGGGGPRDGQRPELPLVYLPRGLDNSSGGQVFVSNDKWGPLAGQLLHFSFGMGTHFLVLRDEVDGQQQGAVVPLPGEFRSGVHRGRFHPTDGQLYVSGMQGWLSFTPDDGCFQRVRYAGGEEQTPNGFHLHQNGVAISFVKPIDESVASNTASHFAQCWNYRYGPGYGSPEFSARHFGMRGHDVMSIHDAHVLDDGHTLFLEVPDLQPVNQLHLHVQSSVDEFHDLFVTVHKLDGPREDLPNYTRRRKVIQVHPIVADLAMATRRVSNPFHERIDKARPIILETGTGLSFAQSELRVRAGEAIALTLANPDVVPHNWVLAKPGTLERVGALADKAISDPDAALRHYVPDTSEVVAYTDVVLPGEGFTIYFHAPEHPGIYPYLCTFPGHWKVMNGRMLVE